MDQEGDQPATFSYIISDAIQRAIDDARVPAAFHAKREDAHTARMSPANRRRYFNLHSAGTWRRSGGHARGCMVEDAHGCRASLGAFAGHLGLHLSLLERNAAEIRESLGSHPANVAVENVSEMLEVKHLANQADLVICDANSNEVAETVKWGLEQTRNEGPKSYRTIARRTPLEEAAKMLLLGT